MSNDNPKCGHTILKSDCSQCIAIQKKWYSKLSKSKFKDIEYGLDNPTLLYEPVPVSYVGTSSDLPQGSVIASPYYEAVWQIYHKWVKEGRSERDCLLCELLAKQDGKTGTVRGISKILRSKKLKPSSNEMVQRTITEINSLIPTNLK